MAEVAPITALHAIKGNNSYKIIRCAGVSNGAWYHLIRDGGRFPLAAGPISFVIKQLRTIPITPPLPKSPPAR